MAVKLELELNRCVNLYIWPYYNKWPKGVHNNKSSKITVENSKDTVANALVHHYYYLSPASACNVF